MKLSIATSIGVVLLTLRSPAQVTQLVSVTANGFAGNSSSDQPSITADGSVVAFLSSVSNLVPGSTIIGYQIYTRDLQSSTTELISRSTSGASGDARSRYPSISGDGRFVAYTSDARNLVPDDLNANEDVFVRDRQLGTTERVSVDSNEVEGNKRSEHVSISADGRFVVYDSSSSNLVPGDTNTPAEDVFLRDRLLGTTERVSLGSGGEEGNNESENPSISADNRYVAFDSLASNFVPGDTNGVRDIFVRDLLLGTTERVSVDSNGVQGNLRSYNSQISGDGRYVVFGSEATNLVAGDANARIDIFVHDRLAGTTERISVDPSGGDGNADSYGPSISPDGRHVVFYSGASDLVPEDTSAIWDVFLRDRSSGTTERISVGPGGVQADYHSDLCAISADARFVAFGSSAGNLAWNDFNGLGDIFLRERQGGTNFSSLCFPNNLGVIPCPCSNPPIVGRGCNNSSSTGGARLTASGDTLVSSDSLVFTTSGERPTALSIVLQGDEVLAAGAVYGQGVRCVGGSLKRLYTKTAAGGSITAPQFTAGDPAVTVRSATLGDPISAGEDRWYLVYYRDPNVLGSCAATSTFNATQTGRVTWLP